MIPTSRLKTGITLLGRAATLILCFTVPASQTGPVDVLLDAEPSSRETLMPAWFSVLQYVYQHGKRVAGSTCRPGLISTRATGDVRVGTVLARAGADLGRAATAPVGLPGAAAAQTRPYGSAGLGERPVWAVQRQKRGRPRPRGPGRAKSAQNGFLGVSGAE